MSKTIREIENMSFNDFKKELNESNYNKLIELKKDIFLIYEQYQESAILSNDSEHIGVNEYAEWVIDKEDYLSILY